MKTELKKVIARELRNSAVLAVSLLLWCNALFFIGETLAKSNNPQTSWIRWIEALAFFFTAPYTGLLVILWFTKGLPDEVKQGAKQRLSRLFRKHEHFEVKSFLWLGYSLWGLGTLNHVYPHLEPKAGYMAIVLGATFLGIDLLFRLKALMLEFRSRGDSSNKGN